MMLVSSDQMVVFSLAVAVWLVLASDIETLSQTLSFNPLVPLSHCMTVGQENSFMIEWSLTHSASRQFIEIRYSVDVQNGFSGAGFADDNNIQIVTGYPTTDLACARTLFDTVTVYDIDGNAYPNFPEVPAKVLWYDNYTVKHYLMRNLSITAARALRDGASLPVNVTVLWSYYMKSLFSSSCYGVPTAPFSEAVTYHMDLNDPHYLRSGAQSCLPYHGPNPKPYRYFHKINPNRPFLNGEIQQNSRATILLFGGGLLLTSGKKAPLFNGRVLGGENANGVCSNSLTHVYAQWYGFSDTVGGIVKYLVSIGTIAKPSLYFSAVSAGTNLAFSGAATLTPNVSYIVTVEAVNFAGLSTTVVSKPVTVLNAGSPVFGKMYAGTAVGTNVKYQLDATTLHFVWTNWETAEHASKNYYTYTYTENGFEYALGVTGGQVDGVRPFVSVPHWANQISLSGLSLQNGVSYSLTVRSINCATQYTTQTSPGIIIDYTPPLPGVIVFGNSSWRTNPHLRHSQFLQASWFGFRDLLSGVASYAWAVSQYARPPSPNLNTFMILPWTSVGLQTSVKMTAKVRDVPQLNSLSYGTRIYFHVKATDAVGNWVVASSNATVITPQ